MGDLLFLIVSVQMPRRLGEGFVRPAAYDDSILLLGHRLDEWTCFCIEGLAGHPSGHSHHHVDDEVAVSLHGGVGIHL